MYGFFFPYDLLSDKMMLFPCRSCMLQADSEKLRQAWIKAVQTSIATAYREKGDESEVSRGVVSVVGHTAGCFQFHL